MYNIECSLLPTSRNAIASPPTFPDEMCPPGAADFVARHLEYREVVGRRVLEVGSHDPDGVVRSIVGPLRPAEYIGADVVVGPGVDIVCPAGAGARALRSGSFDIVVSTEVLEHVQDWRLVVHNLKGLLRDGGMLLVTTRSVGFEFHGYPLDFFALPPRGHLEYLRRADHRRDRV